MNSEFDGLVVAVTGGASGIGAATAHYFGERGAQVAVLDVNVDRVTPSARGIYCDLSDPVSIEAALQALDAMFGRLDVLVNNAGIGATGGPGENDDEQWMQVLDVNVIGTARVTAAALPLLRQSAHGAIVNTCSVLAVIGVPGRVVYAASKGAIAAMTLALAADLLSDGIRVNAVLPGTTDTPWVSRLLEQSGDVTKATRELKARQPIGRLVTPQEVAHAIAYLASPLSASTTGTLLTVDGGMSTVRVPSNN